MTKGDSLIELQKDVLDLLEQMKISTGYSDRKIALDTGVSPSTIVNIRKDKLLSRQTLTTLHRNLTEQLEVLKLARKGVTSAFAEMVNNSSTATSVSLVPLVEIRAKAGYLVEYSNDIFLNTLPLIPISTDREYKGKYMVFEVEGDSMNDGTSASIFDRDRLLCRKVGKEHWRYTLHYKQWFFVIVHRTEGVIVKEIVAQNVEKGIITCHSLNRLYKDDFDIHLNDVVELYEVVELVHRSMKR